MQQIEIVRTGWRKPTRQVMLAQNYAQKGEGMAVSKMQALVAIKRVAAKVGLRAADLMLLDLMCALSQPQDWEEGSRPIVWPSNQFLAEQLGLSERAIQRHCRKLGDLGLISFKDNSNGHRRGRRDKNGYIVEAYGFDLSPLQARAGEFELLYEEIIAERQFIKTMRKEITVARRSIRSMVQMAQETDLQGDWQTYDAKLDQLIETMPKISKPSDELAKAAQTFIDLHNAVKQTYEAAQMLEQEGREDGQNLAISNAKASPTNDKNDVPILNTNYKNKYVKSNLEQVEIYEQQTNDYCEGSKNALEKNNEARAGENNKQQLELKDSNDLKITPQMVQTACPQFIQYAKAMGINKINDWQGLIMAANAILPSIGISTANWNEAAAMIGKNSAAIAVALIFEKYAAQEISTPNGYLRALTARAAIGELHLAKSIYGRLINP